MKWMHPEILWGLLALAIPIIVHLFNFRRFRKVEFSNVQFLKTVQQETKSRSQLKHYLILLSRLLAIAALVFAFAQPYIPVTESENKSDKRLVSIYIDNSFSMNGEGEEGRLVEVAKNKARELVNSYGPTDQFQVLTNDFEGRHQRLNSKDDALELIDEIDISAKTRFLQEVLSRQSDLLKGQEGEKISYILSDLQRSTHQPPSIIDSNLVVRFVPEQSLYPVNVFVDSVWFDTPVRALNQQERLNIRIKHNSAEPRDNIPISLTINSSQKALGSFNIVPGAVTDTVLSFTQTAPGAHQGSLKIDDYPIIFDDEFHISYEVAENVNVMSIEGNQPSKSIQKIFGNDPYYNFSTASQFNIDYSSLQSANLVILNQLKSVSSGLMNELLKFVKQGGTVLFIPSLQGDIQSYSELTLSMGSGSVAQKTSENIKVGKINLDHFVYSGAFERNSSQMDLPQVSSYFSLKGSSRTGEEQLLTFQNGISFLSCFEVEEGRFYYLGSSLEEEGSNFAQHAVFVPTLLRIAEFSQPAQDLWLNVSGSRGLKVQNISSQSDLVYKVRSEDGKEFIPEARTVQNKVELFLHEQVTEDGNYKISQEGNPVSGVSFNYSRTESELGAYSLEEFEQVIEETGLINAEVLATDTASVSDLVSNIDEGRKLWWLFIVLALAFLLIEIFFIKLF
ncbi:MAG: BatA and WFA domain-containing protein [Bacteroidota bacterium]